MILAKIRAKWESGLTAVRLKWDPPVQKCAMGVEVLTLKHLAYI